MSTIYGDERRRGLRRLHARLLRHGRQQRRRGLRHGLPVRQPGPAAGTAALALRPWRGVRLRHGHAAGRCRFGWAGTIPGMTRGGVRGAIPATYPGGYWRRRRGGERLRPLGQPAWWPGTAAAWANPWTGNYGRGGPGRLLQHRHRRTRLAATPGATPTSTPGPSTAAAGGVRYNPETGRGRGRPGRLGLATSTPAKAAGGRAHRGQHQHRPRDQPGRRRRTRPGRRGRDRAASTPQDRAATRRPAPATSTTTANTGDISKGGVVDINGNIYAGKDGKV